jgi:hypothetical protein
MPPVAAGIGAACPALSCAGVPAKAVVLMGVTSFKAKLLFDPVR